MAYMDANKIKGLLEELIAGAAPGARELGDREELMDKLEELDSGETTVSELILSSEDGSRFRVSVSVVELPSG